MLGNSFIKTIAALDGSASLPTGTAIAYGWEGVVSLADSSK